MLSRPSAGKHFSGEVYDYADNDDWNDCIAFADTESMLQFPAHIDQLASLAEMSELRHRVISHNIANVNTPGYQRLDVRFDEELINAKRRGDGQMSKAVVVKDAGTSSRLDGNSVDIDEEIGHLNQNSMLFQTYNQILNQHLEMMRRAVRS